LVTYPFTDYFLNPLKGDFVNADVKFDLDLNVLLENINNASTPIVPLPAVGPSPTGTGTATNDTTPKRVISAVPRYEVTRPASVLSAGAPSTTRATSDSSRATVNPSRMPSQPPSTRS
ncbi:MAG: hypothetical protein ACQSGP_08290, partial [Frankia sp.]